MTRLLGLNRPIPLVDGPTLFLIIAAAIMFAALGLFDLSLKQLIGVTAATILYVMVGFSGLWQMFRQRYF